MSNNASRRDWSGGTSWSIDSTDGEANAAIDSLRPRFAVEAHLTRLFEKENAGDDGNDNPAGSPEPTPLPIAVTDEARTERAKRAADRHDWIGEMGRPDRTKTSGSYRRRADVRASPTDPDATPLRPSGIGAHLGYHDHSVVDGGKARIILTALVTPAEVQDNQPALDLLWRTRFRWKLHPRQVTGDSTDGTVETIAAIEAHRIHRSVPLAEVGQRAGVFGEPDVRSDPVADMYHGPGATVLRFRSQSEATHRRISQARAADCNGCSLRAHCTSSPRGRRIGRSRDEASLDRVRADHAPETYAKAMRKRTVWVEPLFAEAKDRHGLGRFRLRGLEKVTIQAHLIATGQHRKRLLSKQGWGRRPWPSGAAGMVLPAEKPVTVSLS